MSVQLTPPEMDQVDDAYLRVIRLRTAKTNIQGDVRAYVVFTNSPDTPGLGISVQLEVSQMNTIRNEAVSQIDNRIGQLHDYILSFGIDVVAVTT